MRERLASAAAWLALPVSLLLFAQWPLREAVGAGALQANDLAQWLFALYVAVAVAHAGARGAHLVARPDLAARHPRAARRGEALMLLPWSAYLLATSVPPAWRSLLAAERFPESLSPGYFMVRVALVLLAALMLAHALAALRPRRG
jgi:hypothetical protein